MPQQAKQLPMVQVLVPIFDREPGGVVINHGDRNMEIAKQCMECARLRYNLGCSAFRGPIPDAILEGRHDHTREVFPGDQGLLQLRLGVDEYPDLGWADEG